MSFDFLEKLPKANAHDVNKAPEFGIEIVAIPENEGGGFHACIPALGRYFALGDGATALEALESLNNFLKEYVTDDEHRQAYKKDRGIIIP